MKYYLLIYLALTLSPLPASAADTADAVSPDTVLVSTQRTKVTYAELRAELARVPEKDQFEFLMNRQRLATVVENILVNKTLALEAREKGLDKVPGVQAEIAIQIDRVLAKYRGQDIQKHANVPDLRAKVKELYLTSGDRYNLPPIYDTWHVLVDLKGRTREMAIARAEEARQKLLAGVTPEEVAKTYSDDISTYQNKGRLGGNALSVYDPKYAEAVTKMKVGEISPVIESSYGFHVIKLYAIGPGRKIPFEAAKGELEQEAREVYLSSIWEKHVGDIRADKTLKVNVDALEQIRPPIPEIPKEPAAPAASAK